jgi:ferrochelatase
MQQAPSIRASGGAPPFGVLLANTGSPDAPTSRAVRSYLRRFLGDRRVVDLPRWRWWPILNLIVLPLRSPRSARLYRKIWTEHGSPLVVGSQRLGRRLADRLTDELARTTPVEVGMRYGSPDLGSALGRLAESSCRRVVVLPLFPQYSRTTTASVRDAVTAELETGAHKTEIRFVRSYAEHPAYLAALVEQICSHRASSGRGRRLLMSFHGLPRRYADAGDPYPRECVATAKALAARLDLEPGRWHMAYQSRFGREPWLAPELEARLARWGRRGIDGVDVVCPGFPVDCLETLEEVAVTARSTFESEGGAGFRYIPALNDRPEHARALAEIAIEHASGWIRRP